MRLTIDTLQQLCEDLQVSVDDRDAIYALRDLLVAFGYGNDDLLAGKEIIQARLEERVAYRASLPNLMDVYVVIASLHHEGVLGSRTQPADARPREERGE